MACIAPKVLWHACGMSSEPIRVRAPATLGKKAGPRCVTCMCVCVVCTRVSLHDEARQEGLTQGAGQPLVTRLIPASGGDGTPGFRVLSPRVGPIW